MSTKMITELHAVRHDPETDVIELMPDWPTYTEAKDIANALVGDVESRRVEGWAPYDLLVIVTGEPVYCFDDEDGRPVYDQERHVYLAR